jgi:tetratricopeptide (TPR) repeat protein
MRYTALCALLAAALLAAAGRADAATPETDPDGTIEGSAPEDGVDDAADERVESHGFPISEADLPAVAVLSALEYGRPVRARELAEAYLAEEPESPSAHYALAEVLRTAEGHYARALHHFERSVALFEDRYSQHDPDSPWQWHLKALLGSADTLIGMGRYDRALEIFDQLEKRYTGDWRVGRSWPLALSGRHGEARRLSEELLDESDDPAARRQAWTTLCVLWGEARDPEESFKSCMAALREKGMEDSLDPIHQTNAAESALGVLRVDEAERLLLDATRNFQRHTLASPWADLVLLYVDQGRTGEAVSAVRRMVAWREAQSPEARVHLWTYLDMSAATLLLASGRPVEATRLTQRALERPDRDGRNSAATRDLAAAVALLDHAAQRAAAEVRAEEASAAPFPAALGLWIDSFRYRARAWLSGRRTLALVSDGRLLSSRIQARPPGFARVPEWIEPDLVPLLGAGVTAEALATARAERLVDDANGYPQVFEAEIAWRDGRVREARRHADDAWERLPRTEVLLRARVAAIGADVATSEGDTAASLDRFDRVFQLDPGTLRRLGVSLPTSIEAGEGRVAAEAARRLRRSPRFSAEEYGFVLHVEGRDESGSVCLEGARGTLHACVSATLRAGETSEALGRRLALDLQREAFAPRVDLTQADLRSLDGSPINASGRGGERLRIVLSELIGADPSND